MKKTVTLHIDGKKIFAEEGTTILEAARKNGIEIPTLCYHPRLKPMGHCRLCIVSVKGFSKPITSCDNTVAEQMVVETCTPELQDMRSRTLELLLGTHPYEDCLTCVRTGSCELQENSYKHQVKLPPQFERDIPREPVTDNPDIVRDEEKCILCGRCIQVCRSGPGRFVYSMVGNGVNTRVAPVKEGKIVSMEEAGCIFCGQCVDVCPVAALSEVGRASGDREWAVTRAKGLCIECSIGCAVERHSSDGKVIRVTVPREGDKISWICSKGRFGLKTGISRTFSPLKRKDNEYFPINLEDALDECAVNLKNIINKHGAGSVAVLADGRISNEESYLLQKLARTVFNTDNFNLGAERAFVDLYSRIKNTAGIESLMPSAAAVGNAPAIIIFGSHLSEMHPVAAMAVDHAGRYGNAKIVRIGDANGGGPAWTSLELGFGNSRKDVLSAIKEVIYGGDAAKAAERVGIDPEIIRKTVETLHNDMSISIVTADFLADADSELVALVADIVTKAGQLERLNSRVLLLSRYANAAGIIQTGGTAQYGPGMVALKGYSENTERSSIKESIAKNKIKALLTVGIADDNLPAGSDLFTIALGGARESGDIYFPGEPFYYKKGLFTASSGVTTENNPISSQTLPKSDWEVIVELANACNGGWKYNNFKQLRDEMLNESGMKR